MKSILYNIARALVIDPIRSSPGAQNFLEGVHWVVLVLQNYCYGDPVATSGERYVMRRVSKRSSKTMMVFDVGANDGDYANECSKQVVGKHLSIVSFEPSRTAFTRLSKRMANNPVVRAENYALASKNGKLNLFVPWEGSGGSSLVPHAEVYKDRVDLTSYLNNTEEVDCLTLDAYCHRKKIETIDLLKIDVESAEYEVLTGAKRMLSEKRIKAIQFEFGGGQLDSHNSLKDFFDLLHADYRMYRVLGNSVYEMKNYKYQYEVYIIWNVYCELR